MAERDRVRLAVEMKIQSGDFSTFAFTNVDQRKDQQIVPARNIYV